MKLKQGFIGALIMLGTLSYGLFLNSIWPPT